MSTVDDLVAERRAWLAMARRLAAGDRIAVVVGDGADWVEVVLADAYREALRGEIAEGIRQKLVALGDAIRAAQDGEGA